MDLLFRSHEHILTSESCNTFHLILLCEMQVLSSLDLKGLPESKESVCDAGGLDSIPGSRRSPGEGYLQKPTPVLLPGELHGQRSLVGHSSWGRKDSDTTEQLHFPFPFLSLALHVVHSVQGPSTLVTQAAVPYFGHTVLRLSSRSL